MVNKFEVEGFDAFVEKIDILKKNGKATFVLFSGSKDPISGQSWCPDCVVASPVINAALDKVAPKESNFLYVSVGPRSFWKDANNPFRKDPRARVNSVPTLVMYGTPKRLEEGGCSKKNLVEMLFEEE